MAEGRYVLDRLRHSRHVCTSLTIAALVLSGCHRHSGLGTPNCPRPDPSGSLKGPNPTFVRHDLPGLDGPAAVTFETPPYVVGTANDGKGNLTVLTPSAIGLGSIYQPPRAGYDMVTADFDGDGIPDAMSSVYSPTNVDSYAYLFRGSSGGVFSQNPTFGTQYTNPAGYAGYRGRTETVVVADFNNDGAVDIFLPTYTYLDSTYDLSGDSRFTFDGPPPNVYNAYQSFLLLNDGKGNFHRRRRDRGRQHALDPFRDHARFHRTRTAISPRALRRWTSTWTG